MSGTQSIGELKTIINSQVLRRILQKSRIFHQGKVNEFLRAHDWTSASVALGKVDFIDKLGNLVQSEYEKLTEEAKKKDGNA